VVKTLSSAFLNIQIHKIREGNSMKIGTTELLVILAIVLIIFGPSQIPKLTRMFKKSKKNFETALNDDGQ
jgi:sec-independent protein translocase protein TatA